MEEFRRLNKSDLHSIIEVAKVSYERRFFEDYVIKDIIAAFDNNQRYNIELYGFFRGGKLVHFGGFAKSLSIGNTYELRLATTLPEFRGMGYADRSFERRMAILCTKHRDEKMLIQVSTQNERRYLKYGFEDSGYETIHGFKYLFKIIGKK